MVNLKARTQGRSKRRSRALLSASAVLLAVVSLLVAAPVSESRFQFALLGDRTGEAQPGVFEEAWREAAAENPAFVLTVGDTIQGGNDDSVTAEWQSVMKTLEPYRRFKLFLTPGNHDVWDSASLAAFEKYAQHPRHYSFDWQQAHFTVLDDSETDSLSASEMDFLEKDLATHRSQPVKFIISHRPSWLIPVVFGSAQNPVQQLALKYGVKYVIAGHIHQMLHFKLDGVTYLCMASSGGHLRNDKAYEHGWFFQHTNVTVAGEQVTFKIEELSAPFGAGRVTAPDDWGAAGLTARQNTQDPH